MISITIPAGSLAPHVKAVSAIIKRGIKRQQKAHNDGKKRLLKCELSFYSAIAPNVQTFVELTPSALEQEFAALYASHPDFIVFASGSLTNIRRHIGPARRLALYEQLWRRHKTDDAACRCVFCQVSSRAQSVFNWSAFIKRSKDAPRESIADRFVKGVGLKVCPYCSRNHIAPLAEPDRTIYRPDLDHFFAQSVYPYFALCLYNLVPSCSACNCRIKGAVDFLRQDYFHPYEHTAPQQLFVLEGSGVTNVRRLDPNRAVLRLHRGIDKRAKKSAEFFQLPLAYKAHVEEACHFAEALRLFPDSFIKELARMLKVDVHYLMLILDRPDDQVDDRYKHQVLGTLKRDLRLMFRKR